jgi:hypothetical protein
MKQGRGLGGLLGAALALVVAGGGCSLIVAGDVPDFQCSGSSPSACPSGLTCDTTTGQCVADAGDTVDAGDEPTDDGGPAEAGRDAHADADAGPLELGSQCRVDADCKSRICGTSTILTTSITQTTGPICTTPCCSSSECAPSFVCFNGGTGGGYCVPATLAQRTPPASGGKGAGVACAANTECRSGLCTGTPKSCLDTCCGAGDCGGSTTCRVKSIATPAPVHDVWVCAAPESPTGLPPGAACTTGTNPNLLCTSDVCISAICRPGCSSTASCRAIAGFESGHCLYGQSGSDFFKFCFASTFTARDPAGVACNDPSTCQSDYCDAELKKCANVCARDADCAAGEACRPSAANTPFLRCVPKP